MLLMLTTSVIAQTLPVRVPSEWESWLERLTRMVLVDIFGLPPEWMVFPELLYYFILPLTGIMVIVYGFLDTMRIFDNEKINIILSVIIAFTALISTIFVGFVKLVFGLLGPISVGAFALLFLAGLGYISKRKRGEWGTKSAVMSTYHDEAERLRKDLESSRSLNSKLLKEYARTKDGKKRGEIEKKLKTLKNEIDNLEVRLEELKDVMDQP